MFTAWRVLSESFWNLMFALNYINRHSAVFMVLAYLLGFAWPDASNAVLAYLPQVLFALMFFTLLGISQPKLLQLLSQMGVWRYALLHSFGMTLVFVGLAYLLGIRGDVLLALAAMTATGALFGTSAIVRSIGFNPLYAMAVTITSTLLMPIILFINLWLFQTGDVQLDLVLYSKRLLIFIISPMVMSAVVHKLFSEQALQRVHQQLSKITIILVMAFPFGLVGAYRHFCDANPVHGVFLLLMAALLCFGLFALNFWIYRKESIEHAISAAVASAGRNALLTYTIAGPFVGSEFMLLLGAMQLPIYMLPLLSRWWIRWLDRRQGASA